MVSSDYSKIASMLLEKGYRVADDFGINNPEKTLDLILGADEIHNLDLSTKSFGSKNLSCMMLSKVGVMPLGDSANFLSNLKHLTPISTGIGVNSCVVSTCTHSDSSEVANPAAHADSEVHSVGGGVSTDGGDALQEFSVVSLVVACDQRHEQMNEKISECGASSLDETCSKILEYDDVKDSDISNIDRKACEEVLENISRDDNGRYTVPLIWEKSNSHFLSQNLDLSKKILMSIKNKLDKVPDGLKMVNDVITEQLSLKIIEPIPDLNEFLSENPDCSFLAHMPVIKMNNNSTKCRVVFLSNLKESKKQFSVSHNQAMIPGPQLNRPIETSLQTLRFDSNLLIFDICKAFLQLKLGEEDSKRLCFLWFKDPMNGDFTLQGYRSLRLPFGLRCSPTLLMLTLFHMLVHSVDENDPDGELKKNIYECFYMDNGGITSSDSLIAVYPKLSKIFASCGFQLQQFATNDRILKNSYPEVFEPGCETKLLGLTWNMEEDTLSPPKFNLDTSANTKRSILSTIATNYDVLNIGGPLPT